MKPAVIILSVAIAVLLAAVVAVVFMFGTPQAPSPAVAQQNAPVAVQLPGTPPEPEAKMVPPGEVPKPDPNSPLAIQIPGCVCHSDDPKLVEEHSTYRMNQCAGCHSGQIPTGQ